MLKSRPDSIGTIKESSLHRSLKFHYSGLGGTTEALAGTYVCDACTSKGELIEIQTNSFGPLKLKAKNLTKNAKLRIIHPIIIRKQIELYDNAGTLCRTRKSPLKGSIWDLFKVLVYAPELPLLKNLVIELALVEIVEKRVDDGSGSWRRNGVRIEDRVLEAWRHSVLLKNVKDYLQFVPFKEKEQFTSKSLAEKAGIDPLLAGKVLYTLLKIGLVERVGKQGNAFIYLRISP